MVLLLRRQFNFDLFARDNKFSCVDPFTAQLQVGLICHELNSFFQTENLKSFIAFIVLGFAKEELSDFFVEPWQSLGG